MRGEGGLAARRLSWALAMLSALGAFFYHAGALSFALLAGLTLTPLLSLAGGLAARRKVTFSLRAPTALQKQEGGSGELTVKNESRLPLPLVFCCVTAENALTGETQSETFLFSLPARGTRRLPLRFSSRYCGAVRLGLKRAKVYDAFGLLPLAIKTEAACRLCVQPETFVPGIVLRESAETREDSDAYAPDRTGWDLSEPYQLREYAAGDSPRQIHWKLSCKLEKLLVREPSLPLRRSVLVLWERGAEETPAEADAGAEITTSVCRALLEEGILPTLGWNEPETAHCVLQPLAGVEELAAVLPRMLRVRARQTEASGARLVREQAQRFGQVIYIVSSSHAHGDAPEGFARVTRILCGDGAPEANTRFFDTENYARRLDGLEI